MVEDEALHLWTYEQRLRVDEAIWSLEQQIEAFGELDTIAHMTPSAVIRSRCLAALTSRPDIALLMQFGLAAGSEAARALFAEICEPSKVAEPWPANFAWASAREGFDHTVHEMVVLPLNEVDHIRPREFTRRNIVGRGGRGVLVAVLDTGIDDTHVALG